MHAVADPFISSWMVYYLQYALNYLAINEYRSSDCDGQNFISFNQTWILDSDWVIHGNNSVISFLVAMINITPLVIYMFCSYIVYCTI